MKKLLVVFTLVFFLLGSKDLKAQLSVGPGIAYGLDVEELGIMVKGIYSFSDTWRGNADFIYYLDGFEGISLWEANLNANFVFSQSDGFDVYAIGGLNLITASVSFLGSTVSSTEVGLNLGAGGQIFISDKLSVVAELKYGISEADQLVIALGAQFALGGN